MIHSDVVDLRRDIGGLGIPYRKGHGKVIRRTQDIFDGIVGMDWVLGGGNSTISKFPSPFIGIACRTIGKLNLERTVSGNRIR